MALTLLGAVSVAVRKSTPDMEGLVIRFGRLAQIDLPRKVTAKKQGRKKGGHKVRDCRPSEAMYTGMTQSTTLLLCDDHVSASRPHSGRRVQRHEMEANLELEGSTRASKALSLLQQKLT